MHRGTNLVMGVRLALLQEGGANALVFESGRFGSSAGGVAAAAAASAATATATAFAAAAGAAGVGPDVTVRELSLDNTLLGAAVSAAAGP
jgi:uncharacterized protein YciI